jgi:uncharacterized membrane protein
MKSLSEIEPHESGRLEFVDALRGVGLLFMVVDHAYDWWLTEAGNQSSWGRTTEFIGTLAAPIFLVLVGVSMALALDSRRARRTSARRCILLLAKRGLVVVLWGYLVNLLVFFNGDNWGDLFAFDVLQCIGVGMMIFAPLVVWGPTWLLSLLAVVLGLGGQFANRWELPGYLGTSVSGIPPVGYFPVALWLCFIPLGAVWGRALVRWRGNRVASNRLALALLPIGLGAFTGTLFVPGIGYRHPYLVSILFDLAIVAWIGAALYGLFLWACVRRFLGWLSTLGRETLFLYVLHHLVGFRLLYLLGWVSGRSWRGEYGVFDVPQATLFLVLLGVGMYVSTRGWVAWQLRRGGA